MYTPQKNFWSPIREIDQKNGSVSGFGSALRPRPRSPVNGGTAAKGKAVAFLPTDGNMSQESLVERISWLEDELSDYQYNMGLLLIEKREWTSKIEELRKSLADATDALSAISEAKKREENLKKALALERKSVSDLEDALRKMHAENDDVKINADSKMAEAKALLTSTEEKSLEIKLKLHVADAKLAEASRKSSEIERRSCEVDAQENAFQSERSFFDAEREAHLNAMTKQKVELEDWERKLREAEERVTNDRRLLKQREELANENYKALEGKQNALQELRKKNEMDRLTLKNKEDNIEKRLASVAIKENEADNVRKNLELKKKELQEREEKLNSREQLELANLLDEHRKVLLEKQKEFEVRFEQIRKLEDKQLKDKLSEVGQKEAEITHMGEKLKRLEQALEKKLDRLREKEMELDSNSNALREVEKSLQVDETNLENEKRVVLSEKEGLRHVKTETEKLRANTEEQLLRLNQEEQQLKITEDERREFEHQKSELKQEMDKCRYQYEQLNKEANGLKEEKEKFETEWEELDVKRAEIEREQKELVEQKKDFDRYRHSEEERLQNKKLETQQYVQRTLESLKLEKDTFATIKEHEKLLAAENMETEKSRLLYDFEQKKEQLENEVQRRQEEMENRLRNREQLFEKEKAKELEKINCLKEAGERQMENLKLERDLVEKEKLESSQDKKHVEKQQSEIKKDIKELVALSQTVKDQRLQLIKERDRFIALTEKLKSCNTCGEMIHGFMLSNIHTATGLENLEDPLLPKIAENYMREAVEGTSKKLNYESSPIVSNSGSPAAAQTVSWFQKCTSKILNLSPINKLVLDSVQGPAEPSSVSMKQLENEPNPSLQVADDSFGIHMIQSNSDLREVESFRAVSVDQGPADRPEMSQNSDMKTSFRGRGRGGRSRPIRTRSVKAVISGAKNILGEAPEEIENQYPNGNAENSVYTNEGSQAESDLGVTQNNRRKRYHESIPQALASDSLTEGHSDSVKDDDRPKRRQRLVPSEQSLGQKRYNLRQTTRSAATSSAVSSPQVRKGKKGKASEGLPAIENHLSDNVETGGAGEGSAFSEDGLGRFKSARSTTGGRLGPVTTASVDDMVVREEVNESETGVDYFSEDENHGEEDGDNNNEDGELDHPGVVSVGKKIWTFFTT